MIIAFRRTMRGGERMKAQSSRFAPHRVLEYVQYTVGQVISLPAVRVTLVLAIDRGLISFNSHYHSNLGIQ